jgi:hypothetical protein
MMFMDFEEMGTLAERKGAARAEIVRFYGDEGEPLQPFQIYLREARQAHSRGDISNERAEYRKVLDLLHAEGKKRFTGLSHDDEKLEQLIAILLSE